MMDIIRVEVEVQALVVVKSSDRIRQAQTIQIRTFHHPTVNENLRKNLIQETTTAVTILTPISAELSTRIVVMNQKADQGLELTKKTGIVRIITKNG